MVTGELKTKIDNAREIFWFGSSNRLEVMVEIFHQVKQAIVPEEVV